MNMINFPTDWLFQTHEDVHSMCEYKRKAYDDVLLVQCRLLQSDRAEGTIPSKEHVSMSNFWKPHLIWSGCLQYGSERLNS